MSRKRYHAQANSIFEATLFTDNSSAGNPAYDAIQDVDDTVEARLDPADPIDLTHFGDETEIPLLLPAVEGPLEPRRKSASAEEEDAPKDTESLHQDPMERLIAPDQSARHVFWGETPEATRLGVAAAATGPQPGDLATGGDAARPPSTPVWNIDDDIALQAASGGEPFGSDLVARTIQRDPGGDALDLGAGGGSATQSNSVPMPDEVYWTLYDTSANDVLLATFAAVDALNATIHYGIEVFWNRDIVSTPVENWPTWPIGN